MPTRKTPDEVARAEAIGQLESLLIRNGVPTDLAAAQAQEFMAELTNAGWRHTRPRVDPTPPPATPGDPEYRAKAVGWLKAELAAKRDAS